MRDLKFNQEVSTSRKTTPYSIHNSLRDNDRALQIIIIGLASHPMTSIPPPPACFGLVAISTFYAAQDSSLRDEDAVAI
jgi:hypothetical protein